MTDNEIVKALEYCYGHNAGDAPCGDCPRFNHPDGCVHARDALDIINRQKAEISELQHKNSELEAELDDLKRDDLPRCKDALRRANEIGIDLEKENQELKAEIEQLYALSTTL